MTPLGTQLHARTDPADAPLASEMFQAPTARYGDYPARKPRGGLWTSTYDEQHGSDWVQWCIDEDWGLPDDGHWRCWLLVPDPDARVYRIDDYDDLAALVERFPHRQAAWREVHPDFARIAQEYDAIHLTTDGQWRTRLSRPYDLYGWDCESTLWLRWRFADVIDAGCRAFVARGDAERGTS